VNPPGLPALTRYFLRLGSLGFGGPIALVGTMRRDLVERRGWLSTTAFERSLALSQLAPGPLAAQVAFCIGWLHSRLKGAAAVGLAFILPSFLLTVIIGSLYVRHGGLAWLTAAFEGVGAVVIGVIAVSALGLARTTIRGDRLLLVLVLLVAGVTIWRAQELIAVIVLAGVAGGLAARPWRRATAALSVLPLLLVYFAEAGLFVFGSGLAIVPFLHAGVVEQHGWLTERQFLDAVAVALLTPGPVVITAAFIGYLVAGFWGAAAATAGVFLPAFVLALALLPVFDRLAERPSVTGFVRGVTAGAAGALVGAVVVLGARAIDDLPGALLAAAGLGLSALGVPAVLLVLGGAGAGLLIAAGQA
jgi:chromate transporter